MDEAFIVFFSALTIDMFMGEPREFCHPVVWMGGLINYLRRFGNTRLYGAVLAFAVIGVSAGSVGVLLWGLFHLSNTLGLVASAFLLKTTFSITMLTDTARRVGSLVNGDLNHARSELQALVGRDTSRLNHHEARSAVIESVSENFPDGMLAPLLYFTLGLSLNIVYGVVFATVYKSINTLDSMLGYRSRGLRDVGYMSAKLDDILNYVPARLSFFIISAASTSKNAVRIGIRDHGLPSSPNAGWPMAAMAGALRINLYKPGHYSLGSEYSLPETKDIRRSISIIRVSIGIAILLIVGAIWII
jgi:adenosylcobinamide-phosphate synthase